MTRKDFQLIADALAPHPTHRHLRTSRCTQHGANRNMGRGSE